MKDLTEYARAVDCAPTLLAAKQAMEELINQFDHTKKQKLFNQIANYSSTKSRLQQWAWDIVLVGDNMKVFK